MKQEKVNSTIKRDYKSSMFAMVYEDKKELLALYNAVNGTDYKDAALLEINTLENAIYMSYEFIWKKADQYPDPEIYCFL